jgi:hypothetical protein
MDEVSGPGAQLAIVSFEQLEPGKEQLAKQKS